MTTAADLTALELEARQLPSVTAVAYREQDGHVTVQVLVADPTAVAAVRRELEALVARLPTDGRPALEVASGGVPHQRLAFEDDVLDEPGVRGCHVTRGTRGEVRHITVVVDPGSDVSAVRARLTHGVGPDFPPERIQIEATDR